MNDQIFPDNEIPADGTSSVDDSQALEAALAEAERARAEAGEWQDKYLRKLAEFDNYRKRTRQETELLWQAASESVISQFLPVLDDIDRMLSVPGDAEDPYRRGAELVRDKLRGTFEALGVQRMVTVGQPFDPDQHDALLMRPTPDFPAGTVLEEVRPGYRLGDRIVRHAQVIVSAEMEA